VSDFFNDAKEIVDDIKPSDISGGGKAAEEAAAREAGLRSLGDADAPLVREAPRMEDIVPPEPVGSMQHGRAFQERDAATFIALREKSKRPEFLTPYTAEEMRGWKHFVTDDGVGFTLTDKMDIIGVVNNSGKRGAGESAVIEAIAKGGETLNCIDGFLSQKYYPRFGFKESRRVKWNDEYAPKGWNYDKYGRPDIVGYEYPAGLSRDRGDVHRRFEGTGVDESGRGSKNSNSGSGGNQRTDSQKWSVVGVAASGEAGRGVGTSERNVNTDSSLSPDQALQQTAGGQAGRFFINFSRIDAPEDVKTVMQNMADGYRADLEAARRGTRAFEQTALSAEQENAWQILSERRTGQPLNVEQSLAARTLWASSGQKLSELAELAAKAPTEENLFAFRKMLEVHRAVQA
jgi:hypothetical protein